jgi:hypothetical protein
VVHRRLLGVSSRIVLLAVLGASLGLSACSGTQELPDSARSALEAYWESLPSHPAVENRIVRAWPGESTEDGSTSGAPSMETWCVEAEISSSDDPAVDGGLLVWIVMRENDETRWSAALLASMSSIWPYQACGEVPRS